MGQSPHRLFHPGGRTPVGHLMKRSILVAAESEAHKVTTKDVQTDTLYLSQVEIGNPPQQFWLDFDSGSSDLWVCNLLRFLYFCAFSLTH